MGRSLWGMMIRDQGKVWSIDLRNAGRGRTPKQIGVSGMSMGCTTSWWLAAADERIGSASAAACFTRYTELIAHGNLRKHGIYYFVPRVLKHFDTEAIYALSRGRGLIWSFPATRTRAPRSTASITLEKKLGVRSIGCTARRTVSAAVVYEKTGHEYLRAFSMRQEMLRLGREDVAGGEVMDSARCRIGGETCLDVRPVHIALRLRRPKTNESSIQRAGRLQADGPTTSSR